MVSGIPWGVLEHIPSRLGEITIVNFASDAFWGLEINGTLVCVLMHGQGSGSWLSFMWFLLLFWGLYILSLLQNKVIFFYDFVFIFNCLIHLAFISKLYEVLIEPDFFPCQSLQQLNKGLYLTVYFSGIQNMTKKTSFFKFEEKPTYDFDGDCAEPVN